MLKLLGSAGPRSAGVKGGNLYSACGQPPLPPAGVERQKPKSGRLAECLRGLPVLFTSIYHLALAVVCRASMACWLGRAEEDGRAGARLDDDVSTTPSAAADAASDDTVLTASYDGSAMLWDAKSGTSLRRFDPGVLDDPVFQAAKDEGCGEDAMMSCVFSADGARLLTANYDGVARIWCAKTCACTHRFEGTEGGLYTAFFSPDESRVLTAAANGFARLWRVADQASEWVLHGHDDAYMRCAIFSPDGCCLATTSADMTARLWAVEPAGPPTLSQILEGHEGWVNTATFTPDSSLVLTAAADWSARLWRVCSGLCLRTFSGHRHFVRTAVFSPTFTHVLTASFDWTAKLWGAESGERVRTFYGHENIVNSASFSHDGALVLTTSRDQTAKLWCTKTGVCLRTLCGHGSFVVWAVFAPRPSQAPRRASAWKAIVKRARGRLGIKKQHPGSCLVALCPQWLFGARPLRVASRAPVLDSREGLGA